jgi:hypothetical protein
VKPLLGRSFGVTLIFHWPALPAKPDPATRQLVSYLLFQFHWSPFEVVRLRRHDAGQPRAVAARVGRAVGGVQDGGAGDDLPGEVRVLRVHPGIEKCHSRGAGGGHGAEHLVPPDLRQVPLILEEGVVGPDLDLPRLVHLDALDLRIRRVARPDGVQAGRVDGDDVQTERRDRRDLGASVARDDVRDLLRREPAHQLHEEGRRRGRLRPRRERQEKQRQDDEKGQGHGRAPRGVRSPPVHRVAQATLPADDGPPATMSMRGREQSQERLSEKHCLSPLRSSPDQSMPERATQIEEKAITM